MEPHEIHPAEVMRDRVVSVMTVHRHREINPHAWGGRDDTPGHFVVVSVAFPDAQHAEVADGTPVLVIDPTTGTIHSANPANETGVTGNYLAVALAALQAETLQSAAEG